MQSEDTTGESPGQRSGILASNDLVYILPPDLSCTVNQTHKNQYFQSNTYTNQERGVCTLNTGADYADMRHSSLDFGVSITTSGTDVGAWFGRHGSVLNLIKSIVITSRSGDEISRINDFNLLNYTQNGYRYDQQWHDTVGQTIGLQQSLYNISATNTTFFRQRFSIPMYLLSDFFGYGRLMPPMILSGLKIEIEWANPTEAFCVFNSDTRLSLHSGASVTSYTIDNPFFAIRSVQLTDQVQRALNEMSAVNGLELVYCDYERTDTTFTGTDVHLEVRKAASRALKCVMTVRDSTLAALTTSDSLRSQAWDCTRWQWQLGSLYFPQQPIYSMKALATKPEYETLAESYKHALIAFNKYKGNNNSYVCTKMASNGTGHGTQILDVPTATVLPVGGATKSPHFSATHNASLGIGEANADFDYGTFANGNSIVPVLLERSDLFNLSGVPINNSRVLAVRASFSSSTKKTCTTFLKYVRLCRVFMTNVEVEQ